MEKQRERMAAMMSSNTLNEEVDEGAGETPMCQSPAIAEDDLSSPGDEAIKLKSGGAYTNSMDFRDID